MKVLERVTYHQVRIVYDDAMEFAHDLPKKLADGWTFSQSERGSVIGHICVRYDKSEGDRYDS